MAEMKRGSDGGFAGKETETSERRRNNPGDRRTLSPVFCLMGKKKLQGVRVNGDGKAEDAPTQFASKNPKPNKIQILAS